MAQDLITVTHDGVVQASLTVTLSGNSSPFPNVQPVWAPVGRQPLSDAAAAAGVIHQPESQVPKPGFPKKAPWTLQPSPNVAANLYVPTDAELAAFLAATPGLFNDALRRFVTGRPGLPSPSTDDLIQWVSLKWGIPTDWIRAEMIQETGWHQTPDGYGWGLGDKANVSLSDYALYPPAAQRGTTVVNGVTMGVVDTSMGIMQVKWLNKPTFVHSGTEPLRWKSTAFNLDYYAHWVRYCYDGLNVGNPNLRFIPNTQGQEWPSIGQWFGGTAAATANYLADVQGFLAAVPWLGW